MLGPTNSPHLEHLALAMADRGHEVHVAGDLEPSLPISSLAESKIQVSLRPTGGLVEIPGSGLVLRIRWLRILLGQVRPDVVHAHVLSGLPFVAILARARPLVATAWGSDVFRANARARLRNHVVARSADLLTADSSALLRKLQEMGAPSERTLLFNWGVDLELFTPRVRGDGGLRKKLGLGSGPVIFSPRAPVPITNPTTVVQAFEQVAELVPGAQLVLKHWGSVPLQRSLQSDSVRVIGHVTREQMADYYRAADVCVSIPSSDSSPRSVWEAMACGCPCVVSDLEWVGELIEPGADALVVPIEATAVANAILRVLSDPDLAARVSRRGRALVEAHRDQRKELDRLEDLYLSLATRR